MNNSSFDRILFPILTEKLQKPYVCLCLCLRACLPSSKHNRHKSVPLPCTRTMNPNVPLSWYNCLELNGKFLLELRPAGCINYVSDIVFLKSILNCSLKLEGHQMDSYSSNTLPQKRMKGELVGTLLMEELFLGLKSD
jgi:hypothetical protein